MKPERQLRSDGRSLLQAMLNQEFPLSDGRTIENRMKIPWIIFSLAIMLSAVVIVAASIVEAQTPACIQASSDELPVLNLAVYVPNRAALPLEEAAVEVQRNLNDGPWTDLLNLPIEERTLLDHSVVQGMIDHTYKYRARVIKPDGPSAWSDVACFRLSAIVEPK